MPKVSVIIPVYNTEKYLKKCLDSVCNQTLSDIEIICINDCSTDNSLEILNEYVKKDKRIKLIDFKENKGAGAARNEGIKRARGTYIGFIDSDDYIDSDFYEKLYQKGTESNADIIKANLVYENCPPEKYYNIDEVEQFKYRLIHIPTTIIKNTFLKESNLLFPESLCCAEDSVFELQASVKCNKIAAVKDTFYHYVFNDKSLNNTKFYKKNKLESQIKSMTKIVDFVNGLDIDRDTYLDILAPRFTYFRKICNSKVLNEYDKSYLNQSIEALKKRIKYLNYLENYNNVYYKSSVIEMLRNKRKRALL